MRRRLAGMCCLLLLVGACSSSGSETSANYAPIDTATSSTTGSTTAPASGEDATSRSIAPDEIPGPSEDGTMVPASPVSPVSPTEFDAATAAYDSFLALRAQAITRGVELEALDGVATPTAIDQVSRLRAENDERIARDSYAVLDGLVEYSNVTSIDQADGRLVFTDCTERHYRTPAGSTVVLFVTNDVAMVESGDQYVVDHVTEIQDGVVTLTPGEFGCAPPSFAERGMTTAARAVEAVAELVADPAAAADPDLPPSIVGEAREDLVLALQSLATQGLSRTADEIVSYEVLGIDVNRPEFTVVVAVCRTYPTGRSYVDSSGAATQPDLPVGSSYEEWLYVQLEPVPSGTETADAVTELEDRGPNCERS